MVEGNSTRPLIQKVARDDFISKHMPLENIKSALNLGCGSDYIDDPGWINVDGDLNKKADYNWDLEKAPLPFKDEQFDVIWASHILEHITNLVELKKELTRILKPNGKLFVIVPYFLSPCAWGDPTHVRAFSHHAFLKFYWQGFDEIQLGMAKIPCRQEFKHPEFINTLSWLWAVLIKGE